MDPNAALREIRRLIQRINADMDHAPDDAQELHQQCNPSDVARLTELVHSLDQWCSAGGFLPGVWSPRK